MPATPLQKILAKYRATSQTEREKGSYFEELIRTYFRFEASYADLYSDVWLFGDWAKEIGTPEFGIDTIPMKRAVAFCQVIERHAGAKIHKVSYNH
jgi:predicted helicase